MVLSATGIVGKGGAANAFQFARCGTLESLGAADENGPRDDVDMADLSSSKGRRKSDCTHISGWRVAEGEEASAQLPDKPRRKTELAIHGIKGKDEEKKAGPSKGMLALRRARTQLMKRASESKKQRSPDDEEASGGLAMFQFSDVVTAAKRQGFWGTENSENDEDYQLNQEAPDEQVVKPRYILLPQGRLRFSFDIIGLCFILYLSLVIPFELAFLGDQTAVKYKVPSMGFFIDVFFMIDIVLNFFTAYYSKGKLVVEHGLIIRHYLVTFFLLDLVASIPYDMVFWALATGDGGDKGPGQAPKVLRSSRMLKIVRMARALRIVRLLRVLRVRGLVLKLEELVQSQTVTLVASLSKYLLIMVFLAHWEACAWYAIGLYGDNWGYPCTWRNANEGREGFSYPDDPAHFADWYILSLYWAITTMSTVGYGDVNPCNTVERSFAMFSMLGACGMFAMVIGGLQQVLSKFAEERLEFDRMLLRTMRYLRTQQVALSLQYKVKRYLEYNYNNKARTGMDPVLLSNLSETLKNEVLLALLLPIVRRFPLFHNSSRLLLVRICSECATHRFAPNDIVCEAGAIARSMHFVVTGKLKRIKVQDPSVCEHHFEGCWFGEAYLFHEEVREFLILAETFAEVLEITKEAFVKILRGFPNMWGTYESMANSIQAGDLSSIEFKCESCGAVGHASTLCPHALASHGTDRLGLTRAQSLQTRVQRLSRALGTALPFAWRHDTVEETSSKESPMARSPERPSEKDG